jgi:hypothetical protein
LSRKAMLSPLSPLGAFRSEAEVSGGGRYSCSHGGRTWSCGRMVTNPDDIRLSAEEKRLLAALADRNGKQSSEVFREAIDNDASGREANTALALQEHPTVNERLAPSEALSKSELSKSEKNRETEGKRPIGWHIHVYEAEYAHWFPTQHLVFAHARHLMRSGSERSLLLTVKNLLIAPGWPARTAALPVQVRPPHLCYGGHAPYRGCTPCLTTLIDDILRDNMMRSVHP